MRLTDATATPPLAAHEPDADETLDMTDDRTVVASVPDALAIAESGNEELAQLRSQFASRRALEQRCGLAAESFEAVLDPHAADSAARIVAALRAPSASAETVLRLARALFPDDSDLVLVLRELVRSRRMRGLTVGLLETVLEQAEAAADPRALKAGINVAFKARLFGARLQIGPAALRQCYREFLQNGDLAPALYLDWIGAFGAAARSRVLEFVESALFTDMHALDPSGSRREFGEPVRNLRRLRLLRSADRGFVAALLRYLPGEEDCVRLMLAVLLQPRDAGSLLAGACPAGAAPAQALWRACRGLPEELFGAEGGRDEVLAHALALAERRHRHESRPAWPDPDGVCG